MEVSSGQPLLILGCQRSGTSLLCSLLGAHSDINMLYESLSTDVFRLIGKKYNGNKLLAWRQIRLNQKASKWGHLLNRLANRAFSAKKFQKVRICPISDTSLQDYIDKKAKIIIIHRDKQEVVTSIVKRTPMSAIQAEREYDLAVKEMKKVEQIALSVDFHDLVSNTEECLKGICKYLDIPFESQMLDGVKYNAVYPEKTIRSEKSGKT